MPDIDEVHGACVGSCMRVYLWRPCVTQVSTIRHAQAPTVQRLGKTQMHWRNYGYKF